MKNGWKETCLNCKYCDEDQWICKKDGSDLGIDAFQEYRCCELKKNYPGPLLPMHDKRDENN